MKSFFLTEKLILFFVTSKILSTEEDSNPKSESSPK